LVVGCSFATSSHCFIFFQPDHTVNVFSTNANVL
jgi:hypothetical protein